MASEWENLLRELFGDSIGRVSEFREEQVRKIEAKIQEIAHEGLRDEFNLLSNEILDLKRRLASLEAERADNAAEGV